MERMKIVIDGEHFSTIEEFYDEMDKLLTKNLDWKTGHNLDAFNDLLRGGFGVHKYGQPLDILWIHADKSRNDLGYPATELYWQKILEKCHPSNRNRISEKIAACKNHQGPTLFDQIIEIIQDTDDSGHDCTISFEN